jgi:tetratricopeptide (TPR) repeat protein
MTRWILSVSIAMVAIASPVRADELKDQAKRDVAAGLEAQKNGRYDDAIALYKKAYDAVPHPEILYDLGQASRLKGDAGAAIGYYRRYLAVEPNGRVAKDAAKYLAQVEKTFKDDQARKAEQDKAAEAAKQAEEARKAEEAKQKAEEARQAEAARKAEEVKRAELAPRPPPVDTTPRSHRTVYAIAVASVGGAAVIGGLVAGSLAKSKQNAANAICPASACASDADAARANALLAQSRTRGDWATALVAGGAVALGVGGYLLFTGRAHAAPRTAIAPVVAPSLVGVTIGGGF